MMIKLLSYYNTSSVVERVVTPPIITNLLVNLDSEVGAESLANLDNHGSRSSLDVSLSRDAVNLASLALATTEVQSKEGNLSNLHLGVISVASLNLEGLAVIHKLQAGGALLDKANTVIEVQLALGLAVGANSDDELEIVLAERGGGHSALDTLGDDGAAAVVEGDIGGAQVLDEDALALALDLGVGVEVVEDVLGEVGGDGGGVLLDDGADEDAGAEEVLRLDAEGVGVVGVQVEERADEWGAVEGLVVESGVDVIEQAVTDVDRLAGGLGNAVPAVELLGDLGDVAVVVAVEGGEGAEHGPAGAELLGGVVGEAADVGADHGDLVDGGEGEHAADADAVSEPRADVVTEPLADLAAGPGEGAAGDDQRTLGGAAELHGLAGGDGHHWVWLAGVQVLG
jgi:hypothetical protein